MTTVVQAAGTDASQQMPWCS